jgi:hypothetical protein
MDSWRVAVLGDGGVGKTALAVQVRLYYALCISAPLMAAPQFTLSCFVGKPHLGVAPDLGLIPMSAFRVVRPPQRCVGEIVARVPGLIDPRTDI